MGTAVFRVIMSHFVARFKYFPFVMVSYKDIHRNYATTVCIILSPTHF